MYTTQYSHWVKRASTWSHETSAPCINFLTDTSATTSIRKIWFGYWMRSPLCIEAGQPQQIALSGWFTPRNVLEATAHVWALIALLAILTSWFRSFVAIQLTYSAFGLLRGFGYWMWSLWCVETCRPQQVARNGWFVLRSVLEDITRLSLFWRICSTIGSHREPSPFGLQGRDRITEEKWQVCLGGAWWLEAHNYV